MRWTMGNSSCFIVLYFHGVTIVIASRHPSMRGFFLTETTARNQTDQVKWRVFYVRNCLPSFQSKRPIGLGKPAPWKGASS